MKYIVLTVLLSGCSGMSFKSEPVLGDLFEARDVCAKERNVAEYSVKTRDKDIKFRCFPDLQHAVRLVP